MASAGRVGSRKAQRKKPKLTVNDLRKPMGMVYVVTDFADEFRRVYKGPGHEARSLAQSVVQQPMCAAYVMNAVRLLLARQDFLQT